jgi:hypothetical protein
MRREVSPAQGIDGEPDSLTCVKAQCSHTISSWLVISRPGGDGFKWAQDKGNNKGGGGGSQTSMSAVLTPEEGKKTTTSGS